MFSERHLEMLQSVSAKRAGLAPWQGLQDITASVTYQFVKGFTARTLEGKIYNGDGSPVISFARSESGWGSDGFIFAASTAFELYIECKGGAFSVMFNREWFGHINASGQILNLQGLAIGQAMHPSTDSFSVSFITSVRFRDKKNHFPFYINNRVIASIWVSPDFSEQFSTTFSVNENSVGQQIIQLYEKPTLEEEKWLIVFGVIEVAFYGHSMMST